MPRQLKDNSVCCKSVTLDRTLCDEVLSRGYNLTEIFNSALAAVLNADDAYLIRYDSMMKMREEMNRKAREGRLQVIEREEQKAAAEQAAADAELDTIVSDLCADWETLGKMNRDYLAGLYDSKKIDSEALEFFNRRTGKMYRSERYILGLGCVIAAKGQRVKALGLLRSALKK